MGGTEILDAKQPSALSYSPQHQFVTVTIQKP